MRALVAAILLATAGVVPALDPAVAATGPAILAPPGNALLDRCAAVESAANASTISGDYLLSDAVDDCGGALGRHDGRGEASWRWASVTKQIVADLVMQQVEADKLALDTPVNAYVPTLKIANVGRVTLRQLLQHTSGLPNVEDGAVDPRTGSLAAYLRTAPPATGLNATGLNAIGLNAACLGAAKAEPGARFEYNNCDTEVVGAVLVAVSGLSLDRLLENVFGPAGMTQTRLLRPGDPAGHPGYLADGRDDGFIDVARFGAAGAIAGPPADLAKFDRALMGGKLLTPASLAEMWRGDPKLGYAALGQWVYTVPLKNCAKPQKLVERRGEIGGVQVRNIIAPDRNLALVVFTDRPFDFGEPWQGKGGTYDLLSAALCPA